MDMTVITQLYCQLHVTYQLHVSPVIVSNLMMAKNSLTETYS